MDRTRADIGIIGGTGLYDLPGLVDAHDVALETPFGPPSSPVRLGALGGRRVAFLARHGRGHGLMPTEVPYQANVYALKMLGVGQVFAVSAVGSLVEELPPRSVVVIDQLIDRTRRRPLTFFGAGAVAHVGFGDPFCPGLRAAWIAGAKAARLAVRETGTYLNMEGPQFSTRAESLLHKGMGCHVVGMTNATEARLAREAEMCYATLAFVTDYDAWRPHAAGVEATEIFALIHEMAGAAATALGTAIAKAPTADCACRHALRTGLLTPPSNIPDAARVRLAAILAPYL